MFSCIIKSKISFCTKKEGIKMKRFASIITAIALLLSVAATGTDAAMAKAPKKEEVKYEGDGKVEVEFIGDVQWKKPKVYVKDSSGKKYATKIVKKDDDEIEFRVVKYKNGKKYNFTIKGVKIYGTKSYGTVKGKFTIPKKSSSVSRTKAKKIAINNAVKVYKIKRNTVRDYDIEGDTHNGRAVWEIDFEAKKSNGGWYEYEYVIDRKSGKIIYKEQDFD